MLLSVSLFGLLLVTSSVCQGCVDPACLRACAVGTRVNAGCKLVCALAPAPMRAGLSQRGTPLPHPT